MVLILMAGAKASDKNDFLTNALDVRHAPSWVKKVKVEGVTDRIQSRLEWKIRRVPLTWYDTKEKFSQAHSLGELPAAVTIKKKEKASIHIGPKVTMSDYQEILGHELVHVIFYQKYRGAIPEWLEEGFANHLSRKTKVNYKWLSGKTLPADVTKMGHPFKGKTDQVLLHYKVSQALVEMLKSRCDLDNLLRLSVKRKLTQYIKRTCGIQDINNEFKEWVQKKANLQ